MNRKKLLPLLVTVLVGTAALGVAALTQNWKLDAPQVLKSATIVSKQLSTNVVTITTALAHNFQIGEQVFISTDGSPVTDNIAPKDTPFSITGVPTATTFTYARTAGNIPLTAVGGTATIGWLGTAFENRGMTYNDATGHVLVQRGAAAIMAGIHIVNFDGTDVGEMKMGADISNKAKATNVVTLTTAQNHGLAVSQSVFVMCNPPDPAFDGVVTVTAVPTATDFTYTKNGADVASTPTGGTTNIACLGTVALTKIKAVKGGIYGCSLSINSQSLTDVFTVYYWPSETAVPYVIQRNNAVNAATPPTFNVGPRLPSAATATLRFGDTFDVVADNTLPNANVEIYSAKAVQAASGVDRFYKLSFVANSAAVTAAAETLLVGGDSAGGNLPAGSIWVNGFGGPVFVSSSTESAQWTNDGLTRTPTKWSTSPGDFNAGVITSNSNGRGISVGGRDYLAYIERGTSGHPDALNGYGRVALADVTGGFQNAAYVDNTGARTNWVRANTNGTGDVALDDQGARSGRFFAMPSNQYVGSFNVPAVVAPSVKTWDGGAGTAKWVDANNWNPNGVPTTDNDVVLDHSSVAGAYTVQITGLHTVVCRTLTIDAANAASIKLRISGEGEPCGTPFQLNGAGLSDISVSGTYRLPLNKDDNTAPRFRVEILKGKSAVTSKAITSNVATLGTLSSFATNANNLQVGDVITVALNPADALFDGPQTVTAVAAASVSFAVTAANLAATPTYGTVQPATETIRWNNIYSTTVWANGAAGIFGQAGGSGTAIAAATPIAISDGYSIQFAAATGHNTGDAWVFNPMSVGNALVIKGDGTAANDLVVQNGGSLENYVTSRYAYVPTAINVYGGGNKCFFGPNGTYVHGAGIIAVSTQFPSDWTAAPVSYPVFDGATTWDAASNYVMDLYPTAVANVPANYPSVYRSFQFGNVSVLNSYSGIGLADANYSNTANATSVRVKGTLNIGAGASLTLQTSQNVILEGNVTNNGNATGLSLQTGTNPAVQFNGTTTYSGASTGNTLATGFTVTPGSSLTLSGLDLTVPGTKVATVDGVVNTGANQVVAGTSAAAIGSIAGEGKVIGTIKQWVSVTTNTLYNLPLGTVSKNTSCSIEFTVAPTTGGSLTATFTGTDPGDTGLPLVDGLKDVTNATAQGFWTLAAGDGLAGGDYTGKFNSADLTDLNPDPAALRIVKRATAGSWTLDGADGGNVGAIISRTGMTGFSEFAAAETTDSSVSDWSMY
jgi:hypothetical protein